MDPEQVRRFADELKRFNTDLQDKIASLQARFAALGDTWQDQEHAKFAEEFKQTVKELFGELTGAGRLNQVVVSPDGREVAFTFFRRLGYLCILKGLPLRP